MKKDYLTPAVFIRAYEISENLTTSANDFIVDGSVDSKDDTTLDMTGGN